MNTLQTTTNINTPSTRAPRSVSSVRSTLLKLERYDSLYEQAVAKGDLAKAAHYEAELYLLDSQMASVSDNLWTKFCSVDDINSLIGNNTNNSMEGVL